MARIRLEKGRFGWDFFIRNLETGEVLLIQHDWDYPGVARTFGWDGEDRQIFGALQYLDSRVGCEVEDPGYFEGR